MLKETIFLLFIFPFVSTNGCPNGTLEYQSICYFFNNTETGFEAAEISCNNLGGHLVSIHDAFVNDMIGEEAPNYFHGSTDIDLWIGANNLFPSKMWNWMDGSPFDFTDWNKGEPKNISGSSCAALSMTDGSWSAQDCFKPKPFVCSILPIPTPTYPMNYNCSDGWNYFPLTGSCYGINKNGFVGNWMDAENYCQDNGAHLTSIHSFAEFRYLMSYVYVYWKDLWTGFYSPDSGRSWKAADGTEAEFLKFGKWCPGHPLTNATGELCITLEVSDPVGDCFFDTECTGRTQAICKKPIF